MRAAYVAGGVVGLGAVAWLLWRAVKRADDGQLWGAAVAGALDGCDVTPPAFASVIPPPASLPKWTWGSRTAAKVGIDNTPPPDVWGNLEELARAYDAVNEVYPVTVTSAYRCPQLNAHPKIGGVSNSRHLYGRAADLVPLDGDVAALEAQCDALGLFSFTLREATWVHVEILGDGRVS